MKASKVFKSAQLPAFGVRRSPLDAVQDAKAMFPDRQSDVATALMVYGNTILRVVEEAVNSPDADICGMDIIDVPEGTTKGELAARLYPNTTIDCAVPQYFVDKMSRVFDNPARHFVTVYKNHAYDTPKAGNIQMMDGVVMPITDEGIYMLACAANWS